jgi:putative SOS response-associated peptidase YedK
LCNLYSLTKGQQAIRELAGAMSDRTGNLPPLPGIFPDYRAPIVRNQPEGRELTRARWGMPSPLFALKGRNSDSGVTNIRNVKSPHWRRWLDIEHRCVVPFTSFSENETLRDGRKPPVWFGFDETRPLAFFAGIWTGWTSVRKVKEGETTNDVFGFLTTEPNKGSAREKLHRPSRGSGQSRVTVGDHRPSRGRAHDVARDAHIALLRRTSSIRRLVSDDE